MVFEDGAGYAVGMARSRRQIEAQIESIKEELSSLGRLHPGSMSKQYTVCGKAGCGCADSPRKRHGPYYQLSFTRGGKSTTRFVRKHQVTAMKQRLRTYKRLMSLVERWVKLEMQLGQSDA